MYHGLQVLSFKWFTRPHVIGFVGDLFFFHSGERILKYLDSLSNRPFARPRVTWYKSCVVGLPKQRQVHCLGSPTVQLGSPVYVIFYHVTGSCKGPILRMRADGNRIRKEKVANSKLSAYVWTGPKIKFKNNDRLSPKLTVSAKILIIFIGLYFESL